MFWPDKYGGRGRVFQAAGTAHTKAQRYEKTGMILKTTITQACQSEIAAVRQRGQWWQKHLGQI